MGRATKILLVDDSKFLRLATERALTRAGYEVSTAVDGEDALAIARERKPDVILLDMLLPKMAGPDVLKALKNDPETAGIAVVVLTGLSQKNAARLQQDGAIGLLLQGDGRVFDEDHLCPACGGCVITGDIDVAIGIHGDGVAGSIAVARPVVALQPHLIAGRSILDRHDVVEGIGAGRVACDIGIVCVISAYCIGYT